MARGYLDFFGFSSFPYYGVGREENASAAFIAPGPIADIFHVTRKGRLQGGNLVLQCAGGLNLCSLTLTIDGNIFGARILNPVLLPFHFQGDWPIFRSYWDYQLQYMTFHFLPNWVWGYEIRLQLTNASANNCTTTMDMIYYDVV